MNTIARRRLANQHLVAPTLDETAAVVRALGAVQAQDYAGAKWAIVQRTRRLTDADVERAFTTGGILRTHVLRPTWHFILPADARWMLELTAPRIRAAMAYYFRRHGLDAPAGRARHAALERVLRDGHHCTRAELAAALAHAGMDVSSGERVGHLLMQAELDRVIISGPRRGKQFTYALFDERVPAAPRRDRDEALGDLTQRYFGTRGPAAAGDFAWWSGLTVADATRGIRSPTAPSCVRSLTVAHIGPRGRSGDRHGGRRSPICCRATTSTSSGSKTGPQLRSGWKRSAPSGAWTGSLDTACLWMASSWADGGERSTRGRIWSCAS